MVPPQEKPRPRQSKTVPMMYVNKRLEIMEKSLKIFEFSITGYTSLLDSAKVW